MSRISDFIRGYLTENHFFNVSFCIMAIVMLTLPFTTFFMWPAAVLLVLSFFLENNWKEKWQYFKENLGVPYGLMLLGIYLIPVSGLFYSSDFRVALAEIECYMWFLVAPLTLLTISDKMMTVRHLNLLMKIFVLSVVANILFLFTRGITLSVIHHDTIYLYYSHFSILRHPTYATLYTTFAFFLILNYLQKYIQNATKTSSIILYAVEFILALGIFCLYSRAGILIFFALLAVWGMYSLIVFPKRWKRLLCLFAIIICSFSVLMTTDVMPVNRFAKTKYSLNDKYAGNNEKSEARITIWKTSYECIKENLPFGVGTGDAFDVIRDQAVEKGFKNISEKHYNSHNQYLQALLTTGIPGIFLLLCFVSVPFMLAVKFRDMHLLTLFILLSLNCLFECMFEIRSGVDFFAIMIPIFMLRTNHMTENQNQLYETSKTPDK